MKLTSNPAMTGENRMIYLRKALELAKTDAEKHRMISLMGKTGTYFVFFCAGEYSLSSLPSLFFIKIT